MMNDTIGDALERASHAQPFIPDAGEALRRGRRLQARRRRMAIAGVAAIVAVAAAAGGLLVAFTGQHDQTATVAPAPSTAAPPRAPADAALVRQVSTVPTAVFAAVPAHTNVPAQKITGPALTHDGKPVVFWYGAEYSPFSAVERWPLVIALSRFGTWSSLSTITSSISDNPSGLSSFSFYGASYGSPYLAFQSVEAYTNQQIGNFYRPLQAPTPAQDALIKRYDGTNGSIPFIDFGNRFSSSGATYDFAGLQGKTPAEIATALSDPTTDISKAVLGSSNVITAVLCSLTHNQPSAVCDTVAAPG